MAESLTKTLAEKIRKKVQPTDFLDYRLYLKSIYHALKTEIESFNYKTYAELMGFGNSTVLHQIVKGYRPLTMKSSQKISSRLNLKADELEYFNELILYCNAKRTIDKEKSLRKLMALKKAKAPSTLDQDLLDYFGQWYHPIVRELICLTDEYLSPKDIASQLRPPITAEQAKESVSLLERIGYISYDHDLKRFVAGQPRVSSGHVVSGLGLLHYHLQMLERSRESLANSTQEERDFGALTIGASEDLVRTIKEKIHQFQTEILDLAENQDSNDLVYQLNVQLFPMSQKPKGVAE